MEQKPCVKYMKRNVKWIFVLNMCIYGIGKYSYSRLGSLAEISAFFKTRFAMKLQYFTKHELHR